MRLATARTSADCWDERCLTFHASTCFVFTCFFALCLRWMANGNYSSIERWRAWRQKFLASLMTFTKPLLSLSYISANQRPQRVRGRTLPSFPSPPLSGLTQSFNSLGVESHGQDAVSSKWGGACSIMSLCHLLESGVSASDESACGAVVAVGIVQLEATMANLALRRLRGEINLVFGPVPSEWGHVQKE